MTQKPVTERPSAYAVEVARTVATYGMHGIAAFMQKFAEELQRKRPDLQIGVNVEKP